MPMGTYLVCTSVTQEYLMKVDTTVQPAIVPRDLQQKKMATPAVKPAVKSGSEAFNVEISRNAAQAHEAVKTDEISFAKVAAIRDQLAAGTYRISGKDVANKILTALKG